MDRDLNIWVNINPFDNKKEAKPHSDTILQQLLQGELNTSAQVSVLKTKQGKPFIKEPGCFSHSNSRKLHAYVFAAQHEVGLDIEKIEPRRDVLKLSKRYFHPDEYQYLKALSGVDRTLAFYQLWTHKEAWCKLEGGQMWFYMNRSVLSPSSLKTQDGTPIHMIKCQQIKGFACSVATTKPYRLIRINHLA